MVRAAVTCQAEEQVQIVFGLLAEELDAASGRLLDDFPQGISHVGLVNGTGADGGARPGHAAGATAAPGGRSFHAAAVTASAIAPPATTSLG